MKDTNGSEAWSSDFDPYGRTMFNTATVRLTPELDHLAGWLAFHHPEVSDEALRIFAQRAERPSSADVAATNRTVFQALHDAQERRP